MRTCSLTLRPSLSFVRMQTQCQIALYPSVLLADHHATRHTCTHSALAVTSFVLLLLRVLMQVAGF